MLINSFINLCKHCFFAFIFTLFLGFFSYFLLSKVSIDHQKHDQEFITKIMQGNISTLSLKDKVNVLIQSQLFSFIKISNAQNTVIDKYIAKTSYSLPFQAPTHVYYIDNIKVEYRHNNKFIPSSLYQFLLGAFLCAWIAFFFGSFLHSSHVKRLKEAYRKQIISANNLQNTEDEENTSTLSLDDGSFTPFTSGKNTIPEDIDSLTLLKNRNAFVEYFTQYIDNQNTEKFHMIAIAHCSEIQTINQLHGFHEGDNYIVHVANIMKAAIEGLESGQLFRLNCTDFVCLIPDISQESAESFAASLTKGFNTYQSSSEIGSVAYTGIVLFDNPTPLGELLALCDTGINIAQTQSINACHFHQKDQSNSDITAYQRNWHQEIDNVLENQRIKLLLQPVEFEKDHTTIYREVLARFINSHGELLPTTSFISMAEKLGKGVVLDRLIIEKVMADIKVNSIFPQLLGINISARTLNDEYFIIWLERRLLRAPEIASSLIFEITESGLQHNIKVSQRFIEMIHRTGSQVTVEHFGVDLSSFKFFKELTPDYIKMDSSYTRRINEDKNNQYFLQVMIDLAHHLNIKVLAENVENKKELETLHQLMIDGVQGFYIGKPHPMRAEDKA